MDRQVGKSPLLAMGYQGKRKPILCVDFDGVIHSYSSGWISADIIRDGPVDGAFEFLAEASEYFEIHIYSSRSNQPGGIKAMQDWMWFHVTGTRYKADDTVQVPVWLLQIRWPVDKPPAMITLDDRAITFQGPSRWPSMQRLKEFKPWNK